MNLQQRSWCVFTDRLPTRKRNFSRLLYKWI